MSINRWIIEARDAAGVLDFTEPQPEAFFGLPAITGMEDYDIAMVIYHHCPLAELRGDAIATWPQHLDARFIARPRTW